MFNIFVKYLQRCYGFCEGIDVVKLSIPQAADLGIELSGMLFLYRYILLSILLLLLMIFSKVLMFPLKHNNRELCLYDLIPQYTTG